MFMHFLAILYELFVCMKMIFFLKGIGLRRDVY